MKNLLIIVLSVLVSFNLSCMEEKYQLNLDENFNNVIDAFRCNINNELSEEELLINLRQLFAEAIDSKDSSDAYKYLKQARKEYRHLLSKVQKKCISFVIKFIECIELEKKLYALNSRHGIDDKRSEKKFNKLYTQYTNLMNKLTSYMENNNIYIDDVNMATCAGFDTCLLELSIKLCPGIRMLKFLFNHQINLNISDQIGNTPLHFIASLPETPVTKSMTKFLLKNGIDKDAINNDNQRAIEVAVANNNQKIARILGNKKFAAKHTRIKFSSSKCTSPTESDNLRRHALRKRSK